MNYEHNISHWVIISDILPVTLAKHTFIALKREKGSWHLSSTFSKLTCVGEARKMALDLESSEHAKPCGEPTSAIGLPPLPPRIRRPVLPHATQCHCCSPDTEINAVFHVCCRPRIYSKRLSCALSPANTDQAQPFLSALAPYTEQAQFLLCAVAPKHRAKRSLRCAVALTHHVISLSVQFRMIERLRRHHTAGGKPRTHT